MGALHQPTQDPTSQGAATAKAAGATELSVWIGASRHPSLSRDTRLELIIPPHDELAKHETRVVAWTEPLSEGPLAFVKLYLHRPWKPAFEGARTPIRVCREFDRLSRLEDRGVPCTAPLYWGRGASPSQGRVEVLATRLIDGARSLRDAIRQPGFAVGEVAWSDLLGAIDEMHAAGIYHGGLSGKNVLLDAHDRPHLCDLAKSMCYPDSIAGSRMALFDLVHFFHGLAKLIGPEACHEIIRRELEPERAARVLEKLAHYRRGKRSQHLRLRGEFHLRNLWARYGGGAWARDRAPR